MPDPWVLLGLSATAYEMTESGGLRDVTVRFDPKHMKDFVQDYDWEFIEKEDGSFHVHYFKVKNDQ